MTSWWSNYLSPCLVAEERNSLEYNMPVCDVKEDRVLVLSNVFGDLGIELQTTVLMNDYSVCVESVKLDSVAEKYGIVVGAYVLKVNGISMQYRNLDFVLDSMSKAREMDSSYSFLQPRKGHSLLDENPYKMTTFPIPQGARLPGMRPFVENEDTALVEKEENAMEEVMNFPNSHYWMSDRSAIGCYECERPFTLLRRRHHCRSCGQIFCYQCCARLNLTFDPKRKSSLQPSVVHLRKQLVCHVCAKQLKEGLQVVVAKDGCDGQTPQVADAPVSLVLMPPHLALVVEGDTTNDSSSDSKARKNTVSNRRVRSMGPAMSFDSADPFSRKDMDSEAASDDGDDYVAEPQEKARNSHLFSLFPRVQMVTSIERPPLPKRLPLTSNVLLTKEEAERVKLSKSHSDPQLYSLQNRVEKLPGLKRCNSRVEFGPMTVDTLVEQVSELRICGEISSAAPSAMNQTAEMSDQNLLDTNFKTMSGKAVGLADDALEVSHFTKLVKDRNDRMESMRNDVVEFRDQMVVRLVNESPTLYALPKVVKKAWMNVITSFSKRAADSVLCRNDLGDSIDILNYIQVNMFPGGSISQCKYVDGVLYRKSLSRKSMRQAISNPRILIVASSLQYQRQTDHILSLENVASQEVEYMHIVVSKIMTLKPDVLIFGGHVHRIAEELLFQQGVVVIKNAKLDALYRISRSTGAVVLASSDHVDKMLPSQVLGKCNELRVVMYDDPSAPPTARRNHEATKRKKQFLMFEGADASKGCTIILQGGVKRVLGEIWRVMGTVIQALYNARLQRSCLDQFFLSPSLDQKYSIHREWFASHSASMYTALKPNSLTLRAALRERNQLCKHCKAIAIGSNTFSVKSNRGIASSQCACEIVRSGIELRDKILFSACWSKLDAKRAAHSEIMCIEFYDKADCTLGAFLNTYCFNPKDKEFKRAFKTRRLSFSHDVGRVIVNVKYLEAHASQQSPGDGLRQLVDRSVSKILSQNQKILMWNGTLSNERLAKVYVEMNPETYNYSFGRFLEDILFGTCMYTSSHILQHLKGCMKSSNPGYVRYFSKNSIVVSFRYEVVQPILHVALQPVLWKASIDLKQQAADVNELEELAIQVYDTTQAKLTDSMSDLVTTELTKRVLKIMRNEVKHWTDQFRIKLRRSPPCEPFAKNSLVREIYFAATSWSKRISKSMQATVKFNPKIVDSSPKGALPRSWFGAQSPSEDALKDTLSNKKSVKKDSNMGQLASFAKQIATGKYLASPNGSATRSPVDEKFFSPDSIYDDVDSHYTDSTNPDVALSGQLKALGSDEVALGEGEDLLDSATKSSRGGANVIKLGYYALPERLLQFHPNLCVSAQKEVVLVNPNQPTSVIAYALSSRMYKDSLLNNIAAATKLPESKVETAYTTDEYLLKLLRVKTREDFDLPFVDDNDFQPLTKFRCKSYYPLQFHALRNLYYGEDHKYIESLCYCEEWKIDGGKSGAGFLKSLDQRFIAKTIPLIELQMFLSLAQEYFTYMAKTFEERLASMLSKILGVYEISITQEKDTTSTSMCVLIMENLVYDRHIDYLFDLKGKMDGRYKNTTGNGEVLWDGNFVELTRGMPLPVQETVMTLLLSASVNDTRFLSSVQVTDYSMLVGYDAGKQEIVACIIDYIHKYDLLKMVEHAGKRLIQEEREITILNPRQYRKRFRKSILKYFTAVPSRYTSVMRVTSTLGSDHRDVPGSNSFVKPHSSKKAIKSAKFT